MRRSMMVLLAISLFLTACGWRDARVNPRNWFGKSRSVAIEPIEQKNALIPRQSAIRRKREPVDNSVAIAAVTQMRIDPTPTGAILVVTGVSSRQGVFDAVLRRDEADADSPADTLSYTLRVTHPNRLTPVGTEHTRTIDVARSLSNQDLHNIRLIRVQGAKNAVESRRR